MNGQLPLRLDKAGFLDWVQGQEGRYELAEGRVVMMLGKFSPPPRPISISATRPLGICRSTRCRPISSSPRTKPRHGWKRRGGGLHSAPQVITRPEKIIEIADLRLAAVYARVKVN